MIIQKDAGDLLGYIYNEYQRDSLAIYSINLVNIKNKFNWQEDRIKRTINYLRDLNFIDINSYVGGDFSITHIYPVAINTIEDKTKFKAAFGVNLGFLSLSLENELSRDFFNKLSTKLSTKVTNFISKYYGFILSVIIMYGALYLLFSSIFKEFYVVNMSYIVLVCLPPTILLFCLNYILIKNKYNNSVVIIASLAILIVLSLYFLNGITYYELQNVDIIDATLSREHWQEEFTIVEKIRETYIVTFGWDSFNFTTIKPKYITKIDTYGCKPTNKTTKCERISDDTTVYIKNPFPKSNDTIIMEGIGKAKTIPRNSILPEPINSLPNYQAIWFSNDNNFTIKGNRDTSIFLTRPNSCNEISGAYINDQKATIEKIEDTLIHISHSYMYDCVFILRFVPERDPFFEDFKINKNTICRLEVKFC